MAILLSVDLNLDSKMLSEPTSMDNLTLPTLNGCFLRHSNGTEIVALDQNTLLRNEDLILHRWISNVMIVFAILLNLLLLWLVKTRSQQLKAMTPMFIATAVFDLCMSITNLIQGPLPINAYGYVFGFYNQFFTSNNETFNQCVTFINGGLVVSSNCCVALQFGYRLYVVKTGRRPSRQVLVLFASAALSIFTISTIAAFFVYAQTTDNFRWNAAKIIRHMGYEINVHTIVGTTNPLVGLIYRKFIALYGCMLACTVIVVIQLYLQWSFYRNAKKMSPNTRRMYSQLNKVMIALGLCPFLTNLLPASVVPFILKNCSPMNWFHIVRSFILLIPPLANPLTTIIFVHPYRRALLHCLRMIYKKPSTKVSTVTSITSQNQSIRTQLISVV